MLLWDILDLMPQYVRSEGGYKVRGKTHRKDEKQLIDDAIAVEKSRSFCYSC